MAMSLRGADITAREVKAVLTVGRNYIEAVYGIPDPDEVRQGPFGISDPATVGLQCVSTKNHSLQSIVKLARWLKGTERSDPPGPDAAKVQKLRDRFEKLLEALEKST